MRRFPTSSLPPAASALAGAGALARALAIGLAFLGLAGIGGLGLAGCGFAAEGADLGGGPARGDVPYELILAEVASVAVDSPVTFGEDAVLTVRGVHPDGCTVFDRFETHAEGQRIEVTAWAARPIDVCVAAGAPFEARHALGALQPGTYRIVVNETLTADLTVLVAPSGVQCGPQDAAVDAVVLPPATHPEGSARVVVRGELPSACAELEPVLVSRTDDVVRLSVQALTCTEPACPPESQPYEATVDVGPLPLGTWTVEVNGRTFGDLQVVPTAQCALSPLPVGRIEAPSVLTAGTDLPLVLTGPLPSECAAVDQVTHTAADGVVELEARVRECAETCRPAAQAPVDVPYAVPGLTEGAWSLRAGGYVHPVPVTVLAQGACTEAQVPQEALTEVVVASGLYDNALEAAVPAGEPLDVSVFGQLPGGCWSGVGAAGRLDGTRLEITVAGTRCAELCAGLEPLTATWALPYGLEPGAYTVVVNGVERAGFQVVQ